MTEPIERPFTWGFAASALALEGAAPASDWAGWEREGRVARSGAGNGWLTNYRDDTALLRSLGANALRVTIEWARIEPRPGHIDRAAVESYTVALEACQSAGLAPWLTLQHTTLPGWFGDDERGFRDERSRQYYWPRYVDRCAEMFERFAAAWTPIEDPTRWAIAGYWLATRPPGQRGDVEVARAALLGALAANADAYRLLRGTAAPVMCTVAVRDAHRRDGRDELDQAAWSYLGALSTGQFEVRGRPPIELPSTHAAFDAIGIVHDSIGSATALGDCVLRAAELAGPRRLVVAANSVASADDEPREGYLREVLALIATIRREGVALDGYFYSPGIDGYDPDTGFDTPRGVVDRNRTLKPSGRYLAEVLPFGAV